MADPSGAQGTNPSDPARALLVSWLLPGAGHWVIGQRGRAALFGLTVVGVFLAGLWMGGLSTVSVYAHKWAFLLQIFDGPLAMLAAGAHYGAQYLAGHPDVALLPPATVAKLANTSPSALADLGMTFTLVSAAFNVLVMADAFYQADRPEEPKAETA